MPIDTSSYYPEVPGQEGDGYSLNRREGSLFGERPKDPEPPSAPEPQNNPPDPSPSARGSKDDGESGAESVITGVSHFLSWVLVPLLMPVYGLMLAFGLSILDVVPMGMRIGFTLAVAAIDVLIPMALIVVLKRFGLIDDLGLNGQRERLIPYVITALCFGGSAWLMATKAAPMWLTMFFAGGALATVINMLINFRWKISAHAAGIAGVVALLIRIERDGSAEPELFFWLLLTIGLCGLLGSARVWLGRHTVWQVLAGYVVGFCSVFILTMIK
jgi:membrane-associated phospholipid phosphatase